MPYIFSAPVRWFSFSSPWCVSKFPSLSLIFWSFNAWNLNEGFWGKGVLCLSCVIFFGFLILWFCNLGEIFGHYYFKVFPFSFPSSLFNSLFTYIVDFWSYSFIFCCLFITVYFYHYFSVSKIFDFFYPPSHKYFP